MNIGHLRSEIIPFLEYFDIDSIRVYPGRVFVGAMGVLSFLVSTAQPTADSPSTEPIYECQHCRTLVFHPNSSTCPRCETGTLERSDQ